MVRKSITLWITVILMAFSSQAMAGGGQNYPNGAEAFLAGAAPPPGFYFLDYAYYYTADSMKDDNGDDIAAFDDVTVAANVFRFLWMSDKKIMGGNWGMHTFLPIIGVDLNFKASVGPQHTTSYDDTSVPYVIFSPFLLSWHLQEGKLHIVTSLADIYIPTGQDDGNMASVGTNFWTIEPVLGITYMANNWEFSAKFMYDFNSTQEDYATVYGLEVDRDPGQEFHFDYSASYAVTPSFRIGVNGYYYTQTTDDSYDIDPNMPVTLQEPSPIDLLRADEGMRSKVFAVGPGIWYNHKNMFFSLRNQWEMAAENKTEGYNVWAKFTYAF